ncbi:MAG: chitobiase/beta-hexosaminidase C-terminal domain-containing protein [bacterium]
MAAIPLPLGLLLLASLFCLNLSADQTNSPSDYYHDPAWKPRAILPAADALKGDFWPASPKTKVDYNDPTFDPSRLSAVPAPGVHPRVLMSPSDIDLIRAKVAIGEKAPPEFRALWEREKRSKSAFYALVAKDDALGKSLASELMAKVASLEPKIDTINKQPDHDNIWCVEKSITASGDPNPPTEIWALLDYDYLHGWLTPEERERIRKVIARLTKDRISNFMTVPDHMMINNHEGFGMEYIRLMLLIEGEKGFDKRVYDLAAKKARAMLDWYLDEQGMCYESIKGWLNTDAFVAIGRRERDLLKHSHLRAKMDFFRQALRWEDGVWHIRDEMRASAFHVIWMMHYFHPKDEGDDLLYSATLTSHPFLTDSNARWPGPVGITSDLLLLFAGNAIATPDGKPLDWTDQKRVNSLNIPITWKDDVRGYVETRNSWNKEDLHLGFTCKQDFFYGGHEASENNRLILWKDGINWVKDSNMLAVKATFLQNMLTIDGKGLSYPPAPGFWLGVQETPEGVVAAGDGKIGYSFAKVMQVHPLDFPSAKLPYYAPFAEGNYDQSRDMQVAFHPGTVAWNDGYAHTDYGAWSGETRMVESYRTANPVEQAYRTVFLARGEHPYVLVIDDARKDDKKHLFEFNLTLPENVELLDAKNPAIQFQNPEPGAGREDDLLITRPNTPRDPQTGRPIVQKGDPLFLVRSLWRNSPFGFPSPRLEHFNGSPEKPFANFSHLSIPAISESPEFRILLYPHRQGDPIPETSWNEDHSELTVSIKGVKDIYLFAKTDGGRTIFSMTRNGQPIISTVAAPARPELEVNNSRFNANDLRTTRFENQIPEYHFGDKVLANLIRPTAPAVIRYTLDGSIPTAESAVCDGPIAIIKSSELQARLFDPNWPGNNKVSPPLKARFVQVEPAKGKETPPDGSQSGLLAQAYEKKTVLWNDKGFFDASKIMLPDLSKETPTLTARVPDFQLPYVVPTHPMTEQVKGFYRFTGWYQAPVKGTYEFSVNSCGPVLFKVGNQTAIAAKGVFHQQQDTRRGEAVLDVGWHPMELIVTDPVFWNLNSLDPMPFEVTVRVNGGGSASIAASDLRFDAKGVHLAEQPAIPSKEAQTPPAWLEPGAMLSSFDRQGKHRDPDYLDLEGLDPLRRERINAFQTNLRPEIVRDYEGWFHAPTEGLYEFNLPSRRHQNAGLGELRSAYQNQLRIDDEIVVQRGVHGRMPLRKITLQPGWHKLSLRLGASPGEGSVTYPDGQTLPMTAALLSRPTLVDIHPKGVEGGRSLYEIYGSTEIEFNLPEGRHGEIHYTLDGKNPSVKDPIYKNPITLDATTTITATVFMDGKALTLPSSVTINRENIPQKDRIANVDFAAWNGNTGQSTLDTNSSVYIPTGASLVAGRNGGKALSVNRATMKSEDGNPKAVDVNLTHGLGHAGFKITGMRMKDNTLSVGLWFQSDTADGKIFGKDGYNAFGKSYKTVSCSLGHGQLRADPARITGGKIDPKSWHQIVLTSDENATILYLDGEKVAAGSGCKTLNTDSFDFFSDHPALVERVAIYNRVLSPADVKQWFTWEKDHPSP